MSRFAAAVLIFCTFSLAAGQHDARNARETPRKQPWEWTDEERIATLLNDADAAARVGRETASSSAARVETTAHPDAPRPYDVIDGSRDPHLFFEFELFDRLVTMAFADDEATRRAYRAMKDQHLQRLGMPADLWQRLEPLVVPYRATRTRHRELASSGPRGNGRELALIRSQLCRDRVAAIAAARTEFGPQFSKFLYSAIAPTMRQIVLQPPTAGLAERVAATARGECQ